MGIINQTLIHSLCSRNTCLTLIVSVVGILVSKSPTSFLFFTRNVFQEKSCLCRGRFQFQPNISPDSDEMIVRSSLQSFYGVFTAYFQHGLNLMYSDYSMDSSHRTVGCKNTLIAFVSLLALNSIDDIQHKCVPVMLLITTQLPLANYHCFFQLFLYCTVITSCFLLC